MKKVNYDLRIRLNLNKECNFNCFYCYGRSYTSKIRCMFRSRSSKKKDLRHMDISEISANIERLNRRCFVVLSGGGEPFLFPRFVDLCRLLTRKNSILVNTNLSHKNVYKFADEVNPNRVNMVVPSLHITQLEKFGLVEDFIAKTKYLKKKGFKTKVLYIMYPPLFKRFKKDYEFFKSQGIVIEPRAFEGKYLFKEYPNSYSKKQREIIIEYSSRDDNEALFNSDYYKILLNSNLNFKGKKCLAGKSLIIVKPDGMVYRCWGDTRKPIGNFFKRDIRLYGDAKPCEVKKCNCHDGLRYVID